MTKGINRRQISEAIELLKNGEVVAFPTETVYGLGADATNSEAIKKIYLAKGRPSDNPLIVHVSSIEQMKQYVIEIPAYVEALLDEFSPGPITYVLKSNGKISPYVSAGLDTIGIRIPNHPIALTLSEEGQLPIAAPSANISGKPSPTTAQHVKDDLHGKIAGIIDGGPTKSGIESTVIDCTGAQPVVLRLGSVPAHEINKIVKVTPFIRKGGDKRHKAPQSPGLKYKHYAPEMPLMVVVEQEDVAHRLIEIEKQRDNKIGLLWTGSKTNVFGKVDKAIYLGSNAEEVGKNLYASLRTFHKHEIDIIVCFVHSADHIGKAVIDRLERAATKIYATL